MSAKENHGTGAPFGDVDAAAAGAEVLVEATTIFTAPPTHRSNRTAPLRTTRPTAFSRCGPRRKSRTTFTVRWLACSKFRRIESGLFSLLSVERSAARAILSAWNFVSLCLRCAPAVP